MRNDFVVGLIALSVGALAGCSNQVGESVQKAVVDNQSAQSNLEWEQSEAHPERLFQMWREDFKRDASKQEEFKSDLCEELSSLDGQSLTIFENEVRDENNRMLVSSCKDELLNRLEGHHEAERSHLNVSVNALVPRSSLNRFQFPVNIQKRDTSNGYYAVTGDVARKEVILTFDDGPSGVYTDSILRSLREVNAKAIFFLLGKNVRANADIVKRVAADGHAMGSHSKTHACLGTSRSCRNANGRVLSLDEAASEIKAGHQAVQDVLGWVDPFFRFPYGESSPELKGYLRSKSVGEFFWSIDSEDWRAQSNQTLLNNTLSRLEARGRGILLFHDIQRKTAEVMPALLKELYHRGYSIVLLQSSDESARYNSKLVKKNLP